MLGRAAGGSSVSHDALCKSSLCVVNRLSWLGLTDILGSVQLRVGVQGVESKSWDPCQRTGRYGSSGRRLSPLLSSQQAQTADLPHGSTADHSASSAAPLGISLLCFCSISLHLKVLFGSVIWAEADLQSRPRPAGLAHCITHRWHSLDCFLTRITWKMSVFFYIFMWSLKERWASKRS